MAPGRLSLIHPAGKLSLRFRGRPNRTPRVLLMRLELLSSRLNGGAWVSGRGGESSRSWRGWVGGNSPGFGRWGRRMRGKISLGEKGEVAGAAPPLRVFW